MKAFVLFAGLITTAASLSAQTNWQVASPNGLVRATVTLAARTAMPEGSALSYTVEFGPEEKRSTIIGQSPLGLVLAGRNPWAAALHNGDLQPVGHRFDTLNFVRATRQRIDERYELIHGKQRECSNRAEQLTLSFENRAPLGNARLELDVRAYDDGIAFRYRLPEAGKEPRAVQNELTGFNVPADAKVWAAPADKPTMYAPAYETYYEKGIAAGTASPLGFGWSFPFLYRTGERWALITEANVGPNYCASRLSNAAANGVYTIAFADPAEGHALGDVRPSATGTWEMPWRIIMVADSLAGIVESTLVTDVCPPSRVKETSWIKPGRVAWSWWSDNPSPQDGGKQKKFVDLAAEMGWEYMLIDANWDIMDNGNVHDVLRYAKEKGVGVLLWYNSGGAHNIVTEKPRDTLTYPEVRKFELELLKKWGVKGIKVDFFQSDKQNVIQLYHGLLEDAAKSQIMLNFHGCTLPRGWQRTWPHLMSMEAVRGAECYIFDAKYPDQAPVQNTILPFTRNVVGPMDYTPVTFSDNRYPHKTTAAHELALSVLFESGWLHFGDKAEAYRALPQAPKEFLKRVPVVWDETRYVAGTPGDLAVIARRKGDTWYVAGVNAQGTAREEKLKLGSWLGAGKFVLSRIGDGADAKSFATDSVPVEAGAEFAAKFAPYGGFVGTISKR